MINFFIDILQILVVLRLGYSLMKFVFYKKQNKRSITYKAYKLVHNKINYKLDIALKKQKEALYPSRTSDGKVVPIRKTN